MECAVGPPDSSSMSHAKPKPVIAAGWALPAAQPMQPVPGSGPHTLHPEWRPSVRRQKTAWCFHPFHQLYSTRCRCARPGSSPIPFAHPRGQHDLCLAVTQRLDALSNGLHPGIRMGEKTLFSPWSPVDRHLQKHCSDGKRPERIDLPGSLRHRTHS